jgi:rhodanese-related sulfurtransferase
LKFVFRFGLGKSLLIRPVIAEEPIYQNISVQDAKRMIKNSPNVLILDVRNQSEYNLGHLYDAKFVPVYEVENSSIPLNLPPPPTENSLLMDVYIRAQSAFRLSNHINDTILVYCSAGGRSAQACQILIEHGFTKVYNMLGGINAWMQADYPIYTSSHHITIDLGQNNQALLDIQPFLEYQASCTSCQNPNQPVDSYMPSIEVTKTLLEESENHTLTLVSENIDGVITEYTIDKTLLWSQTIAKHDLNRTITLSSMIDNKGGENTQIFKLEDKVQHRDYNLTLYTVLSPLDANMYNTSVTVMSYVPAVGKNEILSSEWVNFNKSLTLSQLYHSIGEATDELAKEYKESDDDDLKQFAQRYKTMATEVKMLSNIVKTSLAEYDKCILNSTALILDDWLTCVLCAAVFYIAIGGVCAAACGCTAMVGCGICLQILALEQYWTHGVTYMCENILGCWTWGQPTYRYLTGTSEYEYYSYVNNHENLRGSSTDSYDAQIYCPDPPSMGQIIGTFNEEYVHGLLQIYGKSAPGGYLSDLYVYVSTDNVNWEYVGFQRVTSTSSYWIDFGYVETCFKYIGVVGYDSGYSVNLLLDCVRVTP